MLICLLGRFRVLTCGDEIPVRNWGKTAQLLAALALSERHCETRDSLIGRLWPDGETTRSRHALNSLVHGMRKLLGDALAGAPPVVHAAGAYRLNMSAGMGVDVIHFDAFCHRAEQCLREGDNSTAVRCWEGAAALYQGDLCVLDDIRAVVERERLRAAYLSVLARLSERYFLDGDYVGALEHALRLLSHDPCREDGHRMVMRCYAHRGERAQAFRQYRTCVHILAAEFDACPEPLTVALFDRLRLDPAGSELDTAHDVNTTAIGTA